MIAIPALDIRGGTCAAHGMASKGESSRYEDPVDIARRWERVGFRRLHIVDLDAVTGQGDNAARIRGIIDADTADVQVGGGIRSRDRVDDMLDAGACHVIVGTRALEDLDWLARLCADRPGEIMLAADVRDRRLVTHGWTRTLPLNILDLVEEVDALALGGLVVTAVHRQGQMLGVDLPLMEDVAERSPFPVIAAGGVADVRDLYQLRDRGVAGAIIGTALYSGALDPRMVASEFAE